MHMHTDTKSVSILTTDNQKTGVESPSEMSCIKYTADITVQCMC